MNIIFIEDVEHVGKKGQMKEVADGFARNFLLPKKLAIAATPAAIDAQERKKADGEKDHAAELEKYRKDAEKLQKMELSLPLAIGSKGQSFGSITTQDITNELEKHGSNIKKEWINLEKPIKQAGEFNIKIFFPYGIESAIKIIVTSKNKKEPKVKEKVKKI